MSIDFWDRPEIIQEKENYKERIKCCFDEKNWDMLAEIIGEYGAWIHCMTLEK
jgi:hypothetical protein